MHKHIFRPEPTKSLQSENWQGVFVAFHRIIRQKIACAHVIDLREKSVFQTTSKLIDIHVIFGKVTGVLLTHKMKCFKLLEINSVMHSIFTNSKLLFLFFNVLTS